MADRLVEIVHHLLAGPSSRASDSSKVITLRAKDESSAGSNQAFLQSKLTWDIGEDGKERVWDADGNGYVGL